MVWCSKAIQAAARNGHEDAVGILIEWQVRRDRDKFSRGVEFLAKTTLTPLRRALDYKAENEEAALDLIRNMIETGSRLYSSLGSRLLAADKTAIKSKNAERLDEKERKLYDVIVDLLESPLHRSRKPVQLIDPSSETSEDMSDTCGQFDTNVVDFYALHSVRSHRDTPR